MSRKGQDTGCLGGCLLVIVVMVVILLAAVVFSYVACVAAGVGLWFLLRHLWQTSQANNPSGTVAQLGTKMGSAGRTVFSVTLCVLVSFALIAGVSTFWEPIFDSSGSSSDSSSSTATQTASSDLDDSSHSPSSASSESQSLKDSSASSSSEKAADSSAGGAAGAAAAAGATIPGASGQLVVRFLDVGQGDATVIEFPDGKTMVIDADSDGASTVNRTLRNDGRGSVTWLVATHPDADHIGGLPGVLSGNQVDSVWAPDASNNTKAFSNFLNAVAAKGLMVDVAYAGERIGEGEGYTIDLLWPPDGASYEDENSYSAVILVTYGSNTFLFTGDAPAEALNRANVGHVDVLKVSHHGSASGTSDAVASKLTPQIAVLSYGIGNDYGHPTQVVLDALRNAGATVYGTGAQGTVTVTSDGTTVSTTTERDGSVEAASDHNGLSSRDLK